MLIRIGYDIALGLPNPSTIVFLLRVHSSRESRLVGAENFRIEPQLGVEDYLDAFGNRCGRVNAPAGTIRFLNHAIVRDSGEPDAYAPEAEESGLGEIPTDTLSFVLPSRYCEVDSELLDFAWKRFAAITPGWPGSRLFVILSTATFVLTIRWLERTAPHWTLSRSG